MIKKLILVVCSGLLLVSCAAPKIKELPPRSRRIVYMDLTRPVPENETEPAPEQIEPKEKNDLND